ncbi:phosphatase 2C-like domain-containing protein [Dactylonectria macrodidyma]|uniref:Phosphatase 2C-like domain-containing protein n=1 Tax=Dactylonectria macrodidyma TaxID=307937 RepID=A0A9P9EFN0_9HYPO|nr:phosphatase 2C-like domain-containing protein [Dactylonectria macrodidyma]
MDEPSAEARLGVAAPFKMGQGDIVTDIRQIEIMPQSDTGSSRTATIHILQHQPTGRPIEDRFSIDVRVREQNGLGVGQTTLLLGVYDGHRGSAAATYVAQDLPSEVLSAAARLNHGTGAQTQLIKETFERFDQQMISSFQDAHSMPTKPAAHAPRRILSSISTKFSRAKRQRGDKSDDGDSRITEEGTTAALRVLSGCTASMLMVKVPHSCQGTPSADIINLGDSRVVVASLNPKPTIQATSVDLNSGVKDEQSLITSQHPGDDPKDIFVGGRLFGETLSTRAFGDGMYKLPLRAGQSTIAQDTAREPPKYSELTRKERDQHRDLINQLSAHQQAAAASKGRAKIIPLTDRFDTLFWAYKSPPYVSSTPQVTKVPLESQDALPNSKASHPIVGIVATDGLWDLVSSEEAVEILSPVLSQTATTSSSDGINIAKLLFDGVVERRGRKPGDDVTILVLIFQV